MTEVGLVTGADLINLCGKNITFQVCEMLFFSDLLRKKLFKPLGEYAHGRIFLKCDLFFR